jgi:hypothetical protein
MLDTRSVYVSSVDRLGELSAYSRDLCNANGGSVESNTVSLMGK